jgi:hypothetical protein
MGERAVDLPAIVALADGLSANHLDVGWGVQTILCSQAFFAAANLRTRVLGPAEFVVGACRALLPADPPTSTLILADWIARLGQDLFNPPNVGGWPEGRAWLTSRSIVGRTKFARALVEGRSIGLPVPIDPSAIASAQGRAASIDGILDATFALLLGATLQPERRRKFSEALKGDSCEAARRAVALSLASPEAQLA